MRYGWGSMESAVAAACAALDELERCGARSDRILSATVLSNLLMLHAQLTALLDDLAHDGSPRELLQIADEMNRRRAEVEAELAIQAECAWHLLRAN